MNTARHDSPRHGTLTDATEQLTLLSPAEVPLQFRLDERTRRRGLAQIALLRQQIAQLPSYAVASSVESRTDDRRHAA
jgi:hypothetical protein